MGRATAWLALALAIGAPACRLDEVTGIESVDALVVDAVLDAGAPRQRVLLHRTIRGGVVRGEPGARVTVRDAQGREVVFHEEERLGACAQGVRPETTDSLRVEASCYSAAMRVEPGASYELRVASADGRLLRGRTRVPGHFDLHTPLPSAASGCRLPAATHLRVAWSPAAGAWSYLAVARIHGLGEALRGQGIEAPDPLELTGISVSERDTTVVLPREFGVFERLDVRRDVLRALQGGFPAGVRVELVVAATDRNYVNGVRGGGFNPSGEVRISSVVGDGVGVFGSMVARRLYLEVGADRPLPPCSPGTAAGR